MSASEIVFFVILATCLVSTVLSECPSECLCIPGTDPDTGGEVWTVNCVDISRMPMSWPDDIQPIKEIYFTNIEEEAITTGMFANFTCVRRISMRFSKIGRIESGAFEGMNGCGSDAVLMLGYNEIDTISSGAFSGISNMASLQIIGGEIGTIKSEAFSQIQTGSIIVSGVTIGQLDSNAFGESLSFTTNFDLPSALNAIPQEVLNNLPELNATGFTGCENIAIEDSSASFVSIISSTINKLGTDAFSGVRSLTLFNLYSNTIGLVETKIFGSNGYADFVSISNNVIEGLAGLALAGLKETQKVVIRNNNVSCAAMDALSQILASDIIEQNNIFIPVDITNLSLNCKAVLVSTTTTTTTTTTTITTTTAATTTTTTEEPTTVAMISTTLSVITTEPTGTDTECPAECTCVPLSDPLTEQEEWIVNCVEISIIPKSWPKNIKEIYFTNIDQETIPTGMFANFNCVRKISLRFSKIRTIESGAFDGVKGCGTDAVLMLGYNEIDMVSNSAFTGMSNMASIQIIGGKIGMIQSEAFSQIQTGSIIVSGVTIGQLKSNVFGGSLSFYTDFNLPSALNALPEEVIHLLPELNNTGLTGCENIAMKDSAISFVTLMSNTIEKISSGVFSGVNSPTLLNIYSNTIGLIETNIFGSEGKADLVSIYNNEIEALADMAFEGLNGSQKFVFMNNNISCSGSDAIEGIQAESVIEKNNVVIPVEESDNRTNCRAVLPTTTAQPNTEITFTTTEIIISSAEIRSYPTDNIIISTKEIKFTETTPRTTSPKSTVSSSNTYQGSVCFLVFIFLISYI